MLLYTYISSHVYVNPVKDCEINLNCICLPYRAVSTIRLGKINQSVNTVTESNHCWFTDLSKTHINVPCGQNVEFFNVKAGVVNRKRWDFTG